MALGRTHDIVNLAALPGFFYFIPKEFYVSFGLGYMVGTFFLSPDMDLPNSRPAKRWGLLRCIWAPYQSLSKHRGLSHLPVVGSLTRLAYLVGVVLFLYFVLLGFVSTLHSGFTLVLTNFNPFEFLNYLFRSEHSLYFVAGVICADVVHILLDGASSLVKKIT